MNALIFTLIVIVLVLPLIALLGLLCYVLWYTLNSNSGADSWSLGRENLSSHGNYRTPPQIGRTCRSSLITAQRTLAGKGYKVFHKACSLHLTMPLILCTPTNKIPIHFFHLTVAQREILLVNVPTDPILYERTITSTLYHDDPSSPRLSPSSATMSLSARCLPALLYYIYLYKSLRPLTPPCPLPATPYLSCWWIEDSTGSWELSPEITSPTFSA